MIMPSVIRDIALNAAKAEYKATRMLGGTACDATIAGCAVMLDIRKIATGQRHDEIAILLLDDPAETP